MEFDTSIFRGIRYIDCIGIQFRGILCSECFTGLPDPTSPPLHFFALDNFGLFQVSSTMEKDAETVGSGELSFQIAQRSSILKICVVFCDFFLDVNFLVYRGCDLPILSLSDLSSAKSLQHLLRWRSGQQTSRIVEDYEKCPRSKVGRGSEQVPRNFELHPPRVGSFCKHNSR